jgi:hypothetical protein
MSSRSLPESRFSTSRVTQLCHTRNEKMRIAHKVKCLLDTI